MNELLDDHHDHRQESVESGGFGREDQATQTDDEEMGDTPVSQRRVRPTSFKCGEFILELSISI